MDIVLLCSGIVRWSTIKVCCAPLCTIGNPLSLSWCSTVHYHYPLPLSLNSTINYRYSPPLSWCSTETINTGPHCTLCAYIPSRCIQDRGHTLCEQCVSLLSDSAILDECVHSQQDTYPFSVIIQLGCTSSPGTHILPRKEDIRHG